MCNPHSVEIFDGCVLSLLQPYACFEPGCSKSLQFGFGTKPFTSVSKVFCLLDNHPKHQYVLNGVCDDSSQVILQNYRWLQRIDALHIFVELFDSIVKAFNEVTSNPSKWSRDSLVDAMSLAQAMLSFEFVLTLRFVERYMSYTESLTRALKAKAIDNTSVH